MMVRMIEGEKVKSLIDSVMEEYGDNLLEVSARISRETGLSPGGVRNCYLIKRIEFRSYRLISIVLLGKDTGASPIHPEAESIMRSHRWDMEGIG